MGSPWDNQKVWGRSGQREHMFFPSRTLATSSSYVSTSRIVHRGHSLDIFGACYMCVICAMHSAGH